MQYVGSLLSFSGSSKNFRFLSSPQKDPLDILLSSGQEPWCPSNHHHWDYHISATRMVIKCFLSVSEALFSSTGWQELEVNAAPRSLRCLRATCDSKGFLLYSLCGSLSHLSYKNGHCLWSLVVPETFRVYPLGTHSHWGPFQDEWPPQLLSHSLFKLPNHQISFFSLLASEGGVSWRLILGTQNVHSPSWEVICP